MGVFSFDRYYIVRVKFHTGFRYRNLHGFARFSCDSTTLIYLFLYCVQFTHSLTAARNQLWVVAPSMLTSHQLEPMRQQQ